MKDPLITLKEASRQLGIHHLQANRLVRYRQLKGIYSYRGHVIRVRQSEVDRFKREHKKGVAV